MKRPRYMVEYMGYTSGTPGGRDDGYPETQYRIFDSLDKLVSSGILEREEGAILSVIYPAEKDTFDDLRLARKRQFELKQAQQRQKDEAEFERLRTKLGK